MSESSNKGRTKGIDGWRWNSWPSFHSNRAYPYRKGLRMGVCFLWEFGLYNQECGWILGHLPWPYVSVGLGVQAGHSWNRFCCLHAVIHLISSNHPQAPLIQACRNLVQRDWQCFCKHTHREGKIAADWLASEALKQPQGYQQLLTCLPGHKIKIPK